MFKKEKLIQTALLLQTLAAGFAIFVYAYLGKFTRLMADDFYHSALIHSGESLWQVAWEKYLHISNRYANIFLFAFDEWLGWGIFTGLLIFLWAFGLYALLGALGNYLGARPSRSLKLAAAVLLVFLSLFQSPNLFQTTYWISGTVTYFSPQVLFSLYLAAFFHGHQKLASKTAIALFSLLSALYLFFIGGLSETVGALHIGILLLCGLLVWFKGEKTERNIALIILGGALVGALASLAAMAFAPANALRAAPAKPLDVFIKRLLEFPYLFILDSLKTLPLPSAFTLLVGFLSFGNSEVHCIFFGRSTQESDKKMQRTFSFFLTALIPLIAFALISMSFAPTAYALSYPEARVQFPARVVLTFALFFEGAVLGILLMREKWRIIGAVFLALAAVYPLRGAWQAGQRIPNFEAYADAWDTRDAYIRSKREDGKMEIAVPPIETLGGVKEFDVDPRHWVNKAAADYYGVDAISVHELDLSYDE